MKFQHAVRAIVIGSVVATLGADAAFADQKSAAPPKMDATAEAAMMAQMMKMAEPGPEHKVLAASVGHWKTISRAWMGPGDPQVSEGMADYASILGGRFFTSHFHGTMMGMPFEGFSIMGYDRTTKTYEGYWMDTMGTMMYPMNKGTWDEASKTMTFNVNWPEAMTGGRADYSLVTKYNGNDNMVFTMSMMHEGKSMPMMEVTYNRVK